MKVFVTLTMLLCVAGSFASFSPINLNFDKIKDKEKGQMKTEKYSLKNIHRPASFFSLSSASVSENYSSSYGSRNALLFPSDFQLINRSEENNNIDESDVQVNSSLHINSGKAVIAYPFSFKLKPATTPLGMFKTPSAPNR